MIKKTLNEYLKIIPGNITTNELQVEAVKKFSEDSEKSPWNEAMGTKFHSLVHEPRSFTEKGGGYFEFWEKGPSLSVRYKM